MVEDGRDLGCLWGAGMIEDGRDLGCLWGARMVDDEAQPHRTQVI
jgi:hypothetical protein